MDTYQQDVVGKDVFFKQRQLAEGDLRNIAPQLEVGADQRGKHMLHILSRKVLARPPGRCQREWCRYNGRRTRDAWDAT